MPGTGQKVCVGFGGMGWGAVGGWTPILVFTLSYAELSSSSSWTNHHKLIVHRNTPYDHLWGDLIHLLSVQLLIYTTYTSYQLFQLMATTLPSVSASKFLKSSLFSPKYKVASMKWKRNNFMIHFWKDLAILLRPDPDTGSTDQRFGWTMRKCFVRKINVVHIIL